MAPFVPFVTEEVHQRLVVDVWDDLPDSVHLRDWPRVDGALVDGELSARMRLVRRVVELGRQARAQSGVKTRQPLGAAVVFATGWADVPDELRALAWQELNVAGEADGAEVGTLVDRSVKPNFRLLGKRFGSRTKAVAAEVSAADPEQLLADPVVRVDGEPVRLDEDELIVTITPREGWAVASEPGVTVGLDVTITPELRRAGLVRDAVRLVQEARKATDLDVSDRIELWWETSSEEVAAALREGHDLLAAEVLATSLTEGRPLADLREHTDDDLELRFWLRLAGG
jgi:isoleucyl-tRNA synthetase